MKRTKNTEASRRSRAKTFRRAIFWGVISLAMYLAVFLNEEIVTQYFTEGGVFSIVIVVTALAFSFVHGSFANYILELIGIRPSQEEDR